MSLANPVPPATYRLAVLCSSDFDSRDTLDDLLGPKLDTISHLFTNGVNQLVTDWARTNGLSYTVIPVAGGRGLPASTRDIVDASDVVLILASAESKSAAQIAQICVARAERDPAFKWRQQPYEPISHWREKVERVAEVVEAMSEDDLAASEWARAVKEVVA